MTVRPKARFQQKCQNLEVLHKSGFNAYFIGNVFLSQEIARNQSTMSKIVFRRC